ncbi:hypothetical protein RN04_07070 [Arthrobacter sp. W1]|nr:hypothetical protein RN04_07070 [Arthrobacter sp. W1]
MTSAESMFLGINDDVGQVVPISATLLVPLAVLAGPDPDKSLLSDIELPTIYMGPVFVHPSVADVRN